MASVVRHHHRHVDNLVTRTGPVESLARSDLVPSSSLPLRSMDIKLPRRASTFNSLTVSYQLLCSDPVTFHVSPLCFGAFDLHLLDESNRSESSFSARLRPRVSHSFSLHQPRGCPHPCPRTAPVEAPQSSAQFALGQGTCLCCTTEMCTTLLMN